VAAGVGVTAVLAHGGRAAAPADAVGEAQTPRSVAETRPEQHKSAHDRSDVFSPRRRSRLADAAAQPDQGRVSGFDFYRDPLDAKRPLETPEEIMRADIAAKAGVMAAQRKLLESRYDLTPRFDKTVTMSRGKPLPIGPRRGSGQGCPGIAWAR